MLGLQHEVAKYLNNLNPAVRKHETDEYWMHLYMEQKKSELSCGLEREDISRDFVILGFNEEKATYLSAKLYKNPLKGHWPITQFAKDIICSGFRYLVRNAIECRHPQGQLNSKYSIRCRLGEITPETRLPGCPAEFSAIDLGEDLANSYLSSYLRQNEEDIEGMQQMSKYKTV